MGTCPFYQSKKFLSLQLHKSTTTFQHLIYNEIPISMDHSNPLHDEPNWHYLKMLQISNTKVFPCLTFRKCYFIKFIPNLRFASSFSHLISFFQTSSINCPCINLNNLNIRQYSMIQFPRHLLENTTNFTTAFPKNHIPNIQQASLSLNLWTHEPWQTQKTSSEPPTWKCLLSSPTSASHICPCSVPHPLTQIFSCTSICSFAAAKAKTMLPSSLHGWCSLPQPCFNSQWAAADWPRSLVWAQDMYTQFYHHTHWEQEDSWFHYQ